MWESVWHNRHLLSTGREHRCSKAICRPSLVVSEVPMAVAQREREAALFCCLLRLGEGLGVLLGSWGLPFSPNSPLNMGTATHPSVLSPPFLKVL